MTFFYSRKIFLGVFILVSVPLFGQNNTRIDIGKDSIDLGEVVVGVFVGGVLLLQVRDADDVPIGVIDIAVSEFLLE